MRPKELNANSTRLTTSQDNPDRYEDVQDSALTDLRGVDTPAFPYTQPTSQEDVQESALTDLNGIETSAFPYTQSILGDDTEWTILVYSENLEAPALSSTELASNMRTSAPSSPSGDRATLYHEFQNNEEYLQTNITTQNIVVSQLDTQFETLERVVASELPTVSGIGGDDSQLTDVAQADSLMPGVPLFLDQSTGASFGDSPSNRQRSLHSQSPRTTTTLGKQESCGNANSATNTVKQ